MKNLDDNLRKLEGHMDDRLFSIKEQLWHGFWALVIVALMVGVAFGFLAITIRFGDNVASLLVAGVAVFIYLQDLAPSRRWWTHRS